MSAADVAPLPAAFYARPVVELAEALLGCTVRCGPCAGVIVETEAYHEREAACHAHVGRTARTHVLFGPPGCAYVYRSYGIHLMLNAVAEAEGVGAAVLIRALRPTEGLELMRERRAGRSDVELCNGPGKLAGSLGLTPTMNSTSLQEGPVRIEPRPEGWTPGAVAVGARIGITKAVDLPWRFCVAGEAGVSRPWPPGMAVPRGRRGGLTPEG